MIRGRDSFNALHYAKVAAIIMKIPDAYSRQTAADVFATEFRKQSAAFDPVIFERACGGRIQGYDIRKGRFHDGTVPPL